MRIYVVQRSTSLNNIQANYTHEIMWLKKTIYVSAPSKRRGKEKYKSKVTYETTIVTA